MSICFESPNGTDAAFAQDTVLHAPCGRVPLGHRGRASASWRLYVLPFSGMRGLTVGERGELAQNARPPGRGSYLPRRNGNFSVEYVDGTQNGNAGTGLNNWYVADRILHNALSTSTSGPDPGSHPAAPHRPATTRGSATAEPHTIPSR